MLVLSRRVEEGLRIGDTIEIKVLDVFATDNSGSRKSKVASIGITAPREVSILRKELADTKKENQAAELSSHGVSSARLAGLLRRKRGGHPPE